MVIIKLRYVEFWYTHTTVAWGKCAKALTKYELLKMKRMPDKNAVFFSEKRLHFCQVPLFIFGCLYFVRALENIKYLVKVQRTDYGRPERK